MLRRHLLVPFVFVVGGCVEFGVVVQDGDGAFVDPTSPLDRDDGSPTSAFTVRLNVSNPVPQVNEQIFLTCLAIDGNLTAVSFAFQSNAARLMADTDRGRATFVVDASDINTELSFTCTATNDSGTSAPSDRIVVIPTGGAQTP